MPDATHAPEVSGFTPETDRLLEEIDFLNAVPCHLCALQARLATFDYLNMTPAEWTEERALMAAYKRARAQAAGAYWKQIGLKRAAPPAPPTKTQTQRAAKALGRAGGRARRDALTEAQRAAIARHAAHARWAKKGATT